MTDFCDTHGLDLPCKKCFEDRLNDFNYLNQMMKDQGVSVDELSKALKGAAEYAKDFGYSLEEVSRIKQNL